jgi:hypothetical protein
MAQRYAAIDACRQQTLDDLGVARYRSADDTLVTPAIGCMVTGFILSWRCGRCCWRCHLWRDTSQRSGRRCSTLTGLPRQTRSSIFLRKRPIPSLPRCFTYSPRSGDRRLIPRGTASLKACTAWPESSVPSFSTLPTISARLRLLGALGESAADGSADHGCVFCRRGETPV